ncbi:hypothetical protein [Rhodococcoides yunnanense]|uniref:hypothetical protein n=1 Tax=Rhodococcoides yunnanense TaxID=278209 RepID=UPI001114C59B|nr:hypothetical protein [Rhodococcus yunnanensis]
MNDNVNTIDEEQIRTAFWTLSDLVLDLSYAWNSQRKMFHSLPFGQGDHSGFLGTDLVLISRNLAAAEDQVYELEAALDSVLIPQSERQTIYSSEGGMTIEDLLRWLHQFLGDEAKTIAIEGGRNGIQTSLTPTAATLQKLVQSHFSQAENDGYPPGLYAARTQNAAKSLERQLTNLVCLSSRISRSDTPILLNIRTERIADTTSNSDVRIRVEARCLNIRPDNDLVLIAGGETVPSDEDRTSIDGDTITSEFTLSHDLSDCDHRVSVVDGNGNMLTEGMKTTLAVEPSAQFKGASRAE